MEICSYVFVRMPILQHAHLGIVAGDFLGDTIVRSILWSRLWWPTLFHHAKDFVKRCDQCQRRKMPTMYDNMPLTPIVSTRSFSKWKINFVRSIKLTKSTHAQYIIVAIDYLTTWVEAKSMIKNDAYNTKKFLYEYIFTRYGLPIEIVSDQGVHFINKVIEYILHEFMVIHRKFASYHPQANGQDESTTKVLCATLTR